jgi:nitrogen fixation protein FixH
VFVVFCDGVLFIGVIVVVAVVVLTVKWSEWRGVSAENSYGMVAAAPTPTQVVRGS